MVELPGFSVMDSQRAAQAKWTARMGKAVKKAPFLGPLTKEANR
jgi:hypothetical protein